MKQMALIWSLCFIIIIFLIVFKNKENNRGEVLKEDLAVYVNDELKDSIPSKEEVKNFVNNAKELSSDDKIAYLRNDIATHNFIGFAPIMEFILDNLVEPPLTFFHIIT